MSEPTVNSAILDLENVRHMIDIHSKGHLALDNAQAEITRLTTELAEAKAKLDGALTLGHGCGWNAREILADRCEEKLKSDLSAARATIAKMREALKKIEARSTDPVPTTMSDRYALDWVHDMAHAALASPAEKEG